MTHPPKLTFRGVEGQPTAESGPLRTEGYQALQRMKGVLRTVRQERNDARAELKAALAELEATKAELATERRHRIQEHQTSSRHRQAQRRVTPQTNQENQS